MPNIHIVLVEPEIPQNTGNIARTCASTGAVLHIVGKMGFRVDDAKLRRAGLDYWHALDIRYYASLEEFYEKNPGAEVWYFTKKAPHVYSEITYASPVYLMFGKESSGLPEDLLKEHYEHTVRIPMREGLRSLNLSNTVAIGVYEVLRQRNFEGMMLENHVLETENENG